MASSAAASDLPTTSTPLVTDTGWRWPAGALGGGLAIVALGALGLNMANTASPDALTAGSIPALSAPSTNAAQGIARDVTTTSFELFSSDPEDSGTGLERQTRPNFAEDQPAAVPPAAGVTPSTAPASTTTVPEAEIQATESLDAANEELLLTAPAPGMLGPFGPAVYGAQDADEILGSFVAVDNLLLTSAKALDGLRQVYLLIDQSWIPATVTGSDPLTDIAVLTVDPGVWELGLPSDAGVVEPIGPDTTIFVGYCPKELLLQAIEAAAISEAGCGPVQPKASPPAVAAETGEDSADEADDAEPYGDDAPADRDDDFNSYEADDVPELQSSERASGGEHTVEIKRRLGNVWSTSATVDRVPGHNVYDLIKTSVPKQKRMAGAALRSTSGDVVGIVVSANGPNVVALPIDRALSAARALMTNGSGSHSWLGLQSISNDTGVWVDQVDETGPAAGLLQPGDRIVTVESVPVQDLDHLIYLIRQAPIGESIVITAIRGQELIVSTLVVAEVPVETEVESE